MRLKLALNGSGGNRTLPETAPLVRSTTLICSPTQLALMRDITDPPSVPELVERYFDDCDLVIVEGYKSDEGPAICLGGLTTTGQTLASRPQGHGLNDEEIKGIAEAVLTLLNHD